MMGELEVGFLGAFCGTAVALLVLTWLPRVWMEVRQREDRRGIMPPETFRVVWGRNLLAFLWRRYVRRGR